MLAWLKTRDGAMQLINIREAAPPPEIRLPMYRPTRFAPDEPSDPMPAEPMVRCYRYMWCLPDGTLLYEEEGDE